MPVYDLMAPPLRAALEDHAEVVSAHFFRIAPRGLERWSLDMPRINNKRQPSTLDVLTYALVQLPAEDLPAALARIEPSMAAAIEAHMPAMREAFAENRRRTRAASQAAYTPRIHRDQDAA